MREAEPFDPFFRFTLDAFFAEPAGPQTLFYSAEAADWNGTDWPFGATTLSNANPALRPTLSGDLLSYDDDYLTTMDPALMAVARAGEFEISVIFRPAEMKNSVLYSFGDSTQNNENSIYLMMLANGQIRYYVDGNVGSGAASITTSMSSPLVVGTDYQITVVSSGGFVVMYINLVEVISNREMSGAKPTVLDIFSVGARHQRTVAFEANGGIKLIEVIEL